MAEYMKYLFEYLTSGTTWFTIIGLLLLMFVIFLIIDFLRIPIPPECSEANKVRKFLFMAKLQCWKVSHARFICLININHLSV